MQPHDVITATKDPIGSIGATFYFHPDTLARGKELNLDGFRFYVLGRGGVLGDVEPAVVGSAFGYFAPGLINKIWTSAKERLAPRQAAAEYLECSRAVGRQLFGELDGLDDFCQAAEAVIGATHPAGLSLYAGVAAEPLPDDAPARAMQLAVTLRELRGSVHLLAVVASAVHPAVAHAIRRPDDVSTFGYQEPPAVTQEDRAKLAAADELTDKLLVPSYAVLDATQAEAFVATTNAMAAALSG
jgi:hypothetical protein